MTDETPAEKAPRAKDDVARLTGVVQLLGATIAIFVAVFGLVRSGIEFYGANERDLRGQIADAVDLYTRSASRALEIKRTAAPPGVLATSYRHVIRQVTPEFASNEHRFLQANVASGMSRLCMERKFAIDMHNAVADTDQQMVRLLANEQRLLADDGLSDSAAVRAKAEAAIELGAACDGILIKAAETSSTEIKDSKLEQAKQESALLATPVVPTAGATGAPAPVGKAASPPPARDGWDIDVFWCAANPGREADAEKLAANLRKDRILAGEPIGDVRVRQLNAAQQKRLNFPLDTVRPDDSERQIGQALVDRAKDATGRTFTLGRSISNTRWYISVFVCGPG